MRRIGLAVVLALSLNLAPLGAEAQQAGKVPRIGFLGATSAFTENSRIEAFRQGLHELGYVEGENIVIEWAEHSHSVSRASVPGLAQGGYAMTKFDRAMIWLC